jgi:cyclopropane fatty-acyl-phospholipid synthase-like methyltransferase
LKKEIEKPYAPACERNQQVILNVLKKIIDRNSNKKLLEIGSGTGQHAVFMAPHFPKLSWQTADLLENHAGINMWLQQADSVNILQPIELQIGSTEFPNTHFDVVFTTNTLHIMSWLNVQQLIKQLGQHLNSGSQVIIYGPFKYQGQFTTDSNAQFDLWLKQQNPLSGVRDFEKIVDLMADSTFNLVEDISMPANNQILYFLKP